MPHRGAEHKEDLRGTGKRRKQKPGGFNPSLGKHREALFERLVLAYEQPDSARIMDAELAKEYTDALLKYTDEVEQQLRTCRTALTGVMREVRDTGSQVLSPEVDCLVEIALYGSKDGDDSQAAR